MNGSNAEIRMISPLFEWKPKGKWTRLSPCGRFQISKVYIHSVGGERYYAYLRKGGPKLCGPHLTAQEAWEGCNAHEVAAND